MSEVLFVGFKGANNASKRVVEKLSPDHVLLTNSFDGLKKDIASLSTDYACVFLFGVDKNLSSTVRIEKRAQKDDVKMDSVLNLETVVNALEHAGIITSISEIPTAYLCNEAYWHLLRKFSGRAVLIHISTIRYVDELFAERMKQAMDGVSRSIIAGES